MSLNQVTLEGRIPFDFEVKGADGNEFVMFSVSVARDYKKEGEQYYQEDLITCKAFKHTAKFIGGNFPKGSHIILVGELRRDDDYEKEGQAVKGQMYCLVEKVYFAPKATDGGTQSKAPTPAAAPNKAPGKTPGTNPLAGGVKTPVKKPF